MNSAITKAAAAAASQVVFDDKNNPTSRAMVCSFMVRGVTVVPPFTPCEVSEMPLGPKIQVEPIDRAIAKRSKAMLGDKPRCTFCFKAVSDFSDLRRCDNALPHGEDRDDPTKACQDRVCCDCWTPNEEFATMNGIGDGNGEEAFAEYYNWDNSPLCMDDEFAECMRCNPDAATQVACVACGYNADNFVDKDGNSEHVHRPFKSPYHEAVARRLVMVDTMKAFNKVEDVKILDDMLASMQVEDTDAYNAKMAKLDEQGAKASEKPHCFFCFKCFYAHKLQGTEHTNYKPVKGVDVTFAPTDFASLRVNNNVVPCGIWQSPPGSATSAADAMISMEMTEPSPSPAKVVELSSSSAEKMIAGLASSVLVASSSPPSSSSVGIVIAAAKAAAKAAGAAAGEVAKASSSPPELVAKAMLAASKADAAAREIAEAFSSSSVAAAPAPTPTGPPVVWRSRVFPPGTVIGDRSDPKKHCWLVAFDHVLHYRTEVPATDEWAGTYYRCGNGHLMHTNPNGVQCEACQSAAQYATDRAMRRGQHSSIDGIFRAYKRDCKCRTTPLSDVDDSEPEDSDSEEKQVKVSFFVCSRCFTLHDEDAMEECILCSHCEDRICPTCVNTEKLDMLECHWCQEDRGANVRTVRTIGPEGELPSVKSDEPYTGVWPVGSDTPVSDMRVWPKSVHRLRRAPTNREVVTDKIVTTLYPDRPFGVLCSRTNAQLVKLQAKVEKTIPSRKRKTREELKEASDAILDGELPDCIPASPITGPPVDEAFKTPTKKRRTKAKCPGAPARPAKKACAPCKGCPGCE